MGLHQRRRLRKPGWPELVGVVLILSAFVCLGYWYTFERTTAWPTAQGKVVNANIDSEIPDLVEVSYTYAIGLTSYEQTWRGYWPAYDSPNALTTDQLAMLEREGYPLTVYYDPGDASLSALHGPRSGTRTAVMLLNIFLWIAAGYFVIRVYPKWRA